MLFAFDLFCSLFSWSLLKQEDTFFFSVHIESGDKNRSLWSFFHFLPFMFAAGLQIHHVKPDFLNYGFHITHRHKFSVKFKSASGNKKQSVWVELKFRCFSPLCAEGFVCTLTSTTGTPPPELFWIYVEQWIDRRSCGLIRRGCGTSFHIKYNINTLVTTGHFPIHRVMYWAWRGTFKMKQWTSH